MLNGNKQCCPSIAGSVRIKFSWAKSFNNICKSLAMPAEKTAAALHRCKCHILWPLLITWSLQQMHCRHQHAQGNFQDSSQFKRHPQARMGSLQSAWHVTDRWAPTSKCASQITVGQCTRSVFCCVLSPRGNRRWLSFSCSSVILSICFQPDSTPI